MLEETYCIYFPLQVCDLLAEEFAGNGMVIDLTRYHFRLSLLFVRRRALVICMNTL